MSQSELLKRVVGVLDALGIPYMLTGSTVSSLQGQPRATHDIDIVVAIKAADARRLAEAFPMPDYYLEAEAIRDAIQHQGMFGLVDNREGDKVDFWVLRNEAFDRSAFIRRCVEQIEGVRVSISQPEDTILSKLRWAQMSGGSEKQMLDCVAVYEVQFGGLDQDYLDRWAATLGVVDLLSEVRKRAAVP